MVMDDDKLKELLQKDMEIDMENILEEISSDMTMQDVVAPEAIHDKLFEQIRGRETERTEEENELIRLGKIYKKKRSRRKYWVIAAAVLCAFALGITSFGGAEKVFKDVRDMFEGKSQTHVDTDENRVDDVMNITEDDAYQKIEDELGVHPVRLHYLPGGMEFVELLLEKHIQLAQMYYRDQEDRFITYKVLTDNRHGSTGMDFEDEILDDYTLEKDGVIISTIKYKVVKDNEIRYRLDFKYKDTQYILFITGVGDDEIKKIVENLYFS